MSLPPQRVGYRQKELNYLLHLHSFYSEMEVPEYRKEHQPLINLLAVSGYPFVLYRMPGDSVAHIFIPATTETLTLSQPWVGKEGFLFAPFDPDESSVLFLHPLNPAAFALKSDKPIWDTAQYNETQQETYLQLIKKTLLFIGDSKVKKIVLSGVFRQSWGGPHRSAQLFESLCALYPDAYCYIAFVPGQGLWAGASPETLVQWEMGQLQTMALAGTLPANSDTSWGLKEAHEHDWVVTYIEKILHQETKNTPEMRGPEEMRAGAIRHLCTKFRIDCSQNEALHIAFKLHPTPAVCGIPQEEALQFIRENEPHPRGLYTGFAGLVSNQQVRLFVNLRCARLGTTEAIIFAGGGITIDSIPEAEWDEINLKRGTLSAALLRTLYSTQTI
ncbi:MAG: chorismate-binding protein [Bacteroidales bacterium]